MSEAPQFQQTNAQGSRPLPPRPPAPVSASSTVSVNGGTLTDANFNVPLHLQNHTITRRKSPRRPPPLAPPHALARRAPRAADFSVNFNGSLSELADTPSRAAWTPSELSIFQSRTRYAPNATKSAERQGNLEQAILMGMKVKKVDSTFPCQLGIKIAGCKGVSRGACPRAAARPR